MFFAWTARTSNRMWLFAWQNLVSRPSRTALAVVGLTVPVLAFLGLFSVSQGIRDLMGGTLGKMQGVMVLSENAPTPIFSELPADMADTLRKIPGTRAVAAQVWRIAPPINGKGGSASAALGLLTRPRGEGVKGLLNTVAIQGQDIEAHNALKSRLFAMTLLPKERGGGRTLDRQDIGKPNILISTKIARDFPNTDGSPKKVGQTLKIGTQDFRVIGIYDTGSVVIDMTIAMDIGVARKLLGIDKDKVSTFDVEGDDLLDADRLSERIEAAIPGVRAQRISQFTVAVGTIMGKLELFLLMAVSLAVLVGAVGIANTMLMSTFERYVEFGVMRTSGWTRRNVLALVTIESALLGLLSGAIGSGLAALAVITVNRFLTDFALVLHPSLIVASVLGALVIATLSGLYPAWRASRMTPMDAIRHSGVT
jgi:putative ABC transport system permease protein